MRPDRLVFGSTQWLRVLRWAFILRRCSLPLALFLAVLFVLSVSQTLCWPLLSHISLLWLSTVVGFVLVLFVVSSLHRDLRLSLLSWCFVRVSLPRIEESDIQPLEHGPDTLLRPPHLALTHPILAGAAAESGIVGAPRILHPTSYILRPTSYILRPTSYILHHTPHPTSSSTSSPRHLTSSSPPSLLHPTSYILHPTSYVLHPTSYTPPYLTFHLFPQAPHLLLSTLPHPLPSPSPRLLPLPAYLGGRD